MLSQVGLDDITPIAIGAGILGTGGGGNPYLGSLHLRQLIKEYGPQTIINPYDLADDAKVVIVGGIGAPTVSIEKLSEGTEMLRAIRLLEKHLREQFDAIVIAEIGGSNSMNPMIAGLQAGIPTIDSDSMGRAFPEIQMSSFLFNDDVRVAPFAMTDARGTNVVVPQTTSDKWAERIARNLVVSMGARGALADTVMTGAQVKEYGIHYTLTLAHALGKQVLQSQKDGDDVPQVIADMLEGRLLLRGKIVDVERRTTKGFARGTVTINSHSGSDQLKIELQNEFLIAYMNGEAIVTVPDLICIVTEETGEPVTTELLRYGTRVAVMGVPAPEKLKTVQALDVVGPKAFGYDEVFKPLPGGVIGKELF
ncbi:MAG: DUF917 domain-containing protein [Anaerolineae bacterium]|nr:DUF917 domain-containing protein [Anaerolineae bacterium]